MTHTLPPEPSPPPIVDMPELEPHEFENTDDADDEFFN